MDPRVIDLSISSVTAISSVPGGMNRVSRLCGTFRLGTVAVAAPIQRLKEDPPTRAHGFGHRVRPLAMSYNGLIAANLTTRGENFRIRRRHVSQRLTFRDRFQGARSLICPAISTSAFSRLITTRRKGVIG